jgi:nucleoside-diphosphate-sugar epimerase
MQTILGSGGAIGNELSKALLEFTDKIRLVSRNPQKFLGDEELISANLLDPEKTEKAIKGSAVVYLTAGLKYDQNIWAKEWPIIMKNVIDSCKKNNSKLVFFDNVYMYDPIYLHSMTEETPHNPVSKKGQVRKQLSDMLIAEVESGNLQALIARSADFYGPSIISNSMLNETVIKNLANNKTANWLGKVDKKHSFTYVPDAAKATAILGNSEDAYNQVWHLPTSPNPLTGKELISLIAQELVVSPKYREVSKNMVRFLGLFVPIMKELTELFYQNDRDYVFISNKFESKFNFTPKSYNEGIKNTISQDYKLKK